MLVRLSGAKSLRDPWVSHLLGEWVAHSPLAKARWAEATLGGYPSLIGDQQIVAVKPYASLLFLARVFIGLLMELHIRKTGFHHISECMTRRGAAYMAATGLRFPRPISSRGEYLDTWKELAKLLELGPPSSVAEPPDSGRSWPLQSSVQYLQSRPALVDTVDWPRPLTFILRGDAYPCAGGSWTQSSIRRLNHGRRARTPAYLWEIGMAMCGDKDMAALATRWADNLQVFGRFLVHYFFGFVLLFPV